MELKAVVCDLDGTLLNNDHLIDDETVNVIRKIANKGVRFFIATGRHHHDASAYVKYLDVGAYLISSNGAKIHDEDDREIFSDNISGEISCKIFDTPISQHVHKSVYTNNHWYVETAMPEFNEFHRQSGFPYTVTSFEKIKGKEITKFLFLCIEQEIMHDLENEMRNRFAQRTNITMSNDMCLEMMDKNVSKSAALKTVLQKCKIDPLNTISFGDGLNDADMLSFTGKGYVMGNADPRLKQKLKDHEVIGLNTENGVAQKLRKIFL